MEPHNNFFTVSWLLLIFSICEQGVASFCQEQCIPKGKTCAILYKGKLPVENKKSEKPCIFNSTITGSHTSYCCKTPKDIGSFLYQTKLNEIARSLAGAEAYEYPYHVKLIGKAGCGGTVYNKDWIITAAHCVKYKGKLHVIPGESYVVAGQNYVGQVRFENLYNITEAFTHEKWDQENIMNGYDIALVRLARPLQLEKGKVQPMRLERKDFVPNYGGKAVVVGYGNVDSRMGIGTKYLMESFAPIHSPAKSVRLSLDSLNANDVVAFSPLPHYLSVGGDDSGITVGQGDSGGSALCIDENKKLVLCGVASFKKCKIYLPCHRPSYYIRVAPFVDWIHDKTKNAKQEEELIFDESIFPTQIPDSEVPGYLVRIAGKNKSCSGTLISPKAILTTAECIFANGDPENLRSFAAIYHYKTGKLITPSAIVVEKKFLRNISKNITKVLERPLGLDDLATIILSEPFKTEVISFPPEGYTVNGTLVEYTMNEKVSLVEARKYLPMDREDCQKRLHVVDSKLTLDEQHLCMQQVLSAEAECNRDIGGPLICQDGKYLCGIKTFHACGFSAFPEIFNNFMSGHLRKIIDVRVKIKK